MHQWPKAKFAKLENLITEVGEKITELNDSPKYCMLFGAGCSANSVPLAGEIIRILQKKSFCKLSIDAHLLKKNK